MNLESLIATYGYAAIAVGTFLEGETILVLGGFAAHRGFLDLGGVMLAAFIGSLCGDQLFFFIGRRHSRWLMGKKPQWKLKIEKVDRMLERYQTLLILSFRFLYGLRTVAPFAIGASSVHYRKFILLNVLGALVWAAAVGAGGYFFGQALEVVLGDIKRYEKYILGGIAVAGLSLSLLRFLWKSRRQDAKKNEPPTTPP